MVFIASSGKDVYSYKKIFISHFSTVMKCVIVWSQSLRVIIIYFFLHSPAPNYVYIYIYRNAK